MEHVGVKAKNVVEQTENIAWEATSVEEDRKNLESEANPVVN
jgi:hypothetical protein